MKEKLLKKENMIVFALIGILLFKINSAMAVNTRLSNRNPTPFSVNLYMSLPKNGEDIRINISSDIVKTICDTRTINMDLCKLFDMVM